MTKSSTDRSLRQVYKFILAVALLYAVITPIWWWMSPVYSRVICSVANVVLNVNLFNNDEVEYQYENGKIQSNIKFQITRPSDNHQLQIKAKPFWQGRLLHFSFTIWAALILATPYGNWKKKLKIFLLGWLIVFGGQVLALFLQTLFGKSIALNNLDRMQEYKLPVIEEYLLAWGGRFFMRIGNKLLPILLWMVVGLPRLMQISGIKRATQQH